MQVNIHINCDNAAFGDGDEKRIELSRCVAALANRFAIEGIDDMRVVDCNGNIVGSVTVS